MRQPTVTRVPGGAVREPLRGSQPESDDAHLPGVLADVNELRAELAQRLWSDGLPRAGVSQATPPDLDLDSSASVNGPALKTNLEDEDLDDVISQHMKRWLHRSPGSADADLGTEQATATSPLEEPLRERVIAENVQNAARQEETPRPRRNNPPASSADLLVLRDLANGHARSALHTCRVERLVCRARRLLTIAIVAMTTSFALLPFTGPGSWITITAGVASFLAAALWTFRFLATVRRLATEA